MTIKDKICLSHQCADDAAIAGARPVRVALADLCRTAGAVGDGPVRRAWAYLRRARLRRHRRFAGHDLRVLEGLPFTVGMTYLAFRKSIDLLTWIGAFVRFASALYITRREAKLAPASAHKFARRGAAETSGGSLACGAPPRAPRLAKKARLLQVSERPRMQQFAACRARRIGRGGLTRPEAGAAARRI